MEQRLIEFETRTVKEFAQQQHAEWKRAKEQDRP
jgi:hypothetical protein